MFWIDNDAKFLHADNKDSDCIVDAQADYRCEGTFSHVATNTVNLCKIATFEIDLSG